MQCSSVERNGVHTITLQSVYLCALNPDVRGAAEGCVLEAVAMLLLLPFMLPLPLRLGRD